MWVKICGTTNLDDARLAVSAGADAVGFVLAAASRRRVTLEAAARISRVLAEESPLVERVGVFEAVDAGQLVAAARAAALTGVQLHGGGGAALARAMKAIAPELAVLAVVSWEIGAPDAAANVRQQIQAMQAAGVERVLLDSKLGPDRGGTGVAFAWKEAAEALADVRDGLKLVVAGGLKPETVAEAVHTLQPWGVDVASGVEESLGRKSSSAVQAFVQAARVQVQNAMG